MSMLKQPPKELFPLTVTLSQWANMTWEERDAWNQYARKAYADNGTIQYPKDGRGMVLHGAKMTKPHTNLAAEPEFTVCVCCLGVSGVAHVYAMAGYHTWTVVYGPSGYELNQRSPVLPEALTVLAVLGEIHG